jgi:hypothetical protein
MENEIKALQSRGFGRNRTRQLELTVSRGSDGEAARLREREEALRAKAEEQEALPVSGKTFARIVATAKKVHAVRAAQERLVETAPRKHTRVEGGTERLGKWLHLLVHNAMKLGLASSPNETVRVMEPNTVFELLLGRSALTCVEDGRLTMWVEALEGADDRRRQTALVEAFNQLGLRCRGRDLVIHLREMSQGKAA